MTVLQTWRAELARRGYQADAAQLAAMQRLQRLNDELVEFKRQRSTKLKRLVNRPKVPRGVWLHGGVGRGKSFLMDCFYANVPVVRKTRQHFHEFMREVHREMESLKGTPDPLDAVAARIARRYRLICFDEFHVSDIADAMILERLMRALFRNGVTFVMTSNYHPDDLYPEGLHRDRVLPAIALIREHVDVMQVDAGTDYRQRTMARVPTWLVPDDDAARAELTRAFESLAAAPDESPVMQIENRELRALRRAGDVVWFDFDTLCGGPRSQNDYLELAALFHTIVLSGVPRMPPSMASEARRFVWLVDVLYDQRVKLLVSAACPPEEVYVAGSMAGEFHRTVSRLVEMQSKEYLAAPRRDAGVVAAG